MHERNDSTNTICYNQWSWLRSNADRLSEIKDNHERNTWLEAFDSVLLKDSALVSVGMQ